MFDLRQWAAPAFLRRLLMLMMLRLLKVIDLAMALPCVSLAASHGLISGKLEHMVLNDLEHLRRKASSLN